MPGEGTSIGRRQSRTDTDSQAMGGLLTSNRPDSRSGIAPLLGSNRLEGDAMEMSGLHTSTSHAPMHSSTSEGSAKLRVLIVEDSPIIRARLMESLAEIPNIEVVGEAETESAALAAMVDRGWDAAVLDLQLRQGTGLGLLKALAQRGRPAHAKVIVFTNYAFPQYRDRSLALGADYFFDKAREFHRVREVLHAMAGGGSAATH